MLVHCYTGSSSAENNYYSAPYYIPVPLLIDSLNNALGKMLQGRVIDNRDLTRYFDFKFTSKTSVTVTSSFNQWGSDVQFRIYGIS